MSVVPKINTVTVCFIVVLGWCDPTPDTPVDEKPPVSSFPENPEVKVRKRYRKKKTKLEEAFPTYLQVWWLFSVLEEGLMIDSL